MARSAAAGIVPAGTGPAGRATGRRAFAAIRAAATCVIERGSPTGAESSRCTRGANLDATDWARAAIRATALVDAARSAVSATSRARVIVNGIARTLAPADARE